MIYKNRKRSYSACSDECLRKYNNINLILKKKFKIKHFQIFFFFSVKKKKKRKKKKKMENEIFEDFELKEDHLEYVENEKGK